MDIFDLISIVGDGYLDAKKSKSDDLLEIFFSGFGKCKAKIDKMCSDDMDSYYKERDRRWKEIEKV